MAWSMGTGTSVPITAAVWRRRFSSAGSRSMRAASTACTVAGTCALRPRSARRQHGLHRGEDLQAGQRCGQPVGTALTYQHPGLDQGPYALLQEERIALGTHD